MIVCYSVRWYRKRATVLTPVVLLQSSKTSELFHNRQKEVFLCTFNIRKLIVLFVRVSYSAAAIAAFEAGLPNKWCGPQVLLAYLSCG